MLRLKLYLAYIAFMVAHRIIQIITGLAFRVGAADTAHLGLLGQSHIQEHIFPVWELTKPPILFQWI